MRLLIIVSIFGLITAIIARSKGRDFFLWWFYGFLLFPFSLIHAIVLRQNVETLDPMQQRNKRFNCPHCSELINLDAKLCQYCKGKIDIIDV